MSICPSKIAFFYTAFSSSCFSLEEEAPKEIFLRSVSLGETSTSSSLISPKGRFPFPGIESKWNSSCVSLTVLYCTVGAWIVKPVASSRGRGIFLVNHPNQVNYNIFLVNQPNQDRHHLTFSLSTIRTMYIYNVSYCPHFCFKAMVCPWPHKH